MWLCGESYQGQGSVAGRSTQTRPCVVASSTPAGAAYVGTLGGGAVSARSVQERESASTAGCGAVSARFIQGSIINHHFIHHTIVHCVCIALPIYTADCKAQDAYTHGYVHDSWQAHDNMANEALCMVTVPTALEALICRLSSLQASKSKFLVAVNIAFPYSWLGITQVAKSYANNL